MFGFSKKKQVNNNNTSASSSWGTEKPKVSLEKSKVSLDKHLVSLKKEKNVDLTNLICQVKLYIDISGSMETRYYDGSVQDALLRLFPIALKFDDDGIMPVAVFDENCFELTPMNLDNYATYVENEILGKGYKPYSGTNYAPVINHAIQNCDDSYPTFILFITDGNCWDPAQADKAFRESAEHKMFIQCVGIGNENFKYLKKIDDLDGRRVDNTAFVEIKKLENLTDEELYSKLLEQYPDWLKAMNVI